MRKNAGKKEIGHRLRGKRIELGLSQERFAEVLGTSMRTIQGYERGERSIPGELFLRLHKKFRVDPSSILLGKHSDKLGDFKVAIDHYTKTNGISLDAKKRTAIVDRWAKSLESGREIDMTEVHFWIEMASTE